MVFLDDGVNEIRDWLNSSSATAPLRINIGDDSTSPLKTDSSLANELTRIAFDTTTISNKQIEFTSTLLSTEQNGESLKEFGLNNAITNGTQFTRSTYATIDKTSSIEIRYRVRLRLLN